MSLLGLSSGTSRPVLDTACPCLIRLSHKQEKLHLFFTTGGEELRPNYFQGEQIPSLAFLM